PTGSDYRIKITATSDSLATDFSQTPIIIQPAPSVTMLAPSGGEIWKQGTTHALQWSSSGIPETDVRLDLYPNGQLFNTITTTPLMLGLYNWEVPLSLPAGANYQIRVTSLWDQTYFDDSNGLFQVPKNAVDEKAWTLY